MKELYSLQKRAKKSKKVSADGSLTLYSEEFGECYHSLRDGALRESLKKHVEVAFSLQTKRDTLRILDICFGLGYNTLATLYFLKEHNLKRQIEIISPEFDKDLVKSLKEFSYPREFEEFEEIIWALSQKGYFESEDLKIKILFEDARVALKSLDQRFDIIYQDPFSPKKIPSFGPESTLISSIKSLQRM